MPTFHIDFNPIISTTNIFVVQLDTCADVDLMPESVYKLIFNNPQTSKLAKNDIDLTMYTRHSVDLIGKCTFYMLSKGTKQPVKVDFYIAKEEGSVLLSWETVFQLQLLDVKPRLEYLPPKATCSYPVQWIILKEEIHAQSMHLHNSQNSASILPTSKPKIPQDTPRRHTEESQNHEDKGTKFRNSTKNFLKGIGQFPGEAISYSYQIHPLHLNKHPADPYLFI